MSLEKNQIIELNITDISSDGSGIGHYDSMAVFVPFSAVGDRLEVRVVKALKSYAFGKIERVISPSADRINIDCPAYPKCGGCSMRHISYEAECKAKEQWVNDAFRRIGGIDLQVERFIPAENPDRYRNKAQLPYRTGVSGKGELGFFAQRSHRVIPCGDCVLQPEEFSGIIDDCRDFFEQSGNIPYDERQHKGRVRHLYLRRSVSTGDITVCTIVNGNGLAHEDEFVRMLRQKHPEVTGVVINSNRDKTNVIMGKKCRTAWGADKITDSLCKVVFKISPLSFFQVNPVQAERLYTAAREYAGLTGRETVLDLYCGAGTIGLTMAAYAGRVIGAEIVPEAIEDAKENAAANGIENAEFYCGDAVATARMLKARAVTPDVVILDPPRKGCAPELPEVIASMTPERIVYVSCDPATLARDAARFADVGYKAERLTAVDMFPRTSNVETVCLLSKLNAKQHIEVDIHMDELDLTDAEKKATYGEIKEYVLEHTGLKVSSLYIAQVKQKCGIIERENYNKPKSEDARQPQCPPDKEKAIKEALLHFGMI